MMVFLDACKSTSSFPYPSALNHLSFKSTIALSAVFSIANFLSYTDVFSVMVIYPLRQKLRKALPSSMWTGILSSILAARWTSNIPGNPYAMDEISTVIAGPFPSLVDYNACMPALSLPVILVGTPPHGARYWSIQVFLKGAANALNDRAGGKDTDEDDAARRNQTMRDIDVVVDHDGKFRVAIGDFQNGQTSPCKNVIQAGDSKTGLLVMRCFKLPEGMAWQAPSLYAPGSNTPWPTLYQERCAGPFATSRGPTSNFERLKTLAIASATIVAIKPELAPALVAGAAGAKFLHSSVLKKFMNKYKKIKCPTGTIKNGGIKRVSGLGGNIDHVYWVFCYDASECDIEITGVLKSQVGSQDGFRYTNLSCYKWTSIPLPNFLDDDSFVPDPNLVTEGVSVDGAQVTQRFTAYLTTERTFQKGINEMNVTDSVDGTGTLRLLLPLNESITELCTPKIRSVPKGFRRPDLL